MDRYIRAGNIVLKRQNVPINNRREYLHNYDAPNLVVLHYPELILTTIEDAAEKELYGKDAVKYIDDEIDKWGNNINKNIKIVDLFDDKSKLLEFINDFKIIPKLFEH